MATAIDDILTADVVAAFHRLVDRRGPDECWPWRGNVGQLWGYIEVRRRGRRCRLTAHRVAYALEHGDAPGRQLSPTCGERLCCNPDHWRPRVSEPRPASTAPKLHLRDDARIDVTHPWFAVAARADVHPKGTVARRVKEAIRFVHGVEADWGLILDAVATCRTPAGELRDAYLEQYLALGGLAVEAA